MLLAHALEMPNEVGVHEERKHRGAILVAFSGADQDLVRGEIDVLDAKLATFPTPSRLHRGAAP
jgi:hypothetical protein